MKPELPNRFDEFCREAFDFLESAGVRHLVIGGLAVVAVGEPRMTGDVDVVGFLSQTDARRLIDRALESGFVLDVRVEQEALEMTGTLRFRKPPFQLDIILASLPFEETAYSRSTTRKMFRRAIRFPTPEDLILFKVLAGRPKDQNDAIGIIRRHGTKLDRAYIEETLRSICDLAESMEPMRRFYDAIDAGS